jgi:hypothetical protein
MKSSIPAAVHSLSQPGTTSTNGRGVGWRMPSCVGIRRRYGAHGCDLSHAIEGASRTSRSTLAGWLRPSSSAIRPPMLLPTTWGRVEVEHVQQRRHRPREEPRVVGLEQTLIGVAEAGQVHGDGPVGVREGIERGQEGRLGRTEAVEEQHRLAGAGLDHRARPLLAPRPGSPGRLPGGPRRPRSPRRDARRPRRGCGRAAGRRRTRMGSKRSTSLRGAVSVDRSWVGPPSVQRSCGRCPLPRYVGPQFSDSGDLCG